MDKEAHAVDLRAAGYSYEEIAQTLGYRTRSAAYKAVTRALERRPAHSVERMRATMGARMDLLNKAAFSVLTDPESQADARLKAIMAAVRIAERQAKLFGVDAQVGSLGRGDEQPITVVFTKELEVNGMNDAGVIEIDP